MQFRIVVLGAKRTPIFTQEFFANNELRALSMFSKATNETWKVIDDDTIRVLYVEPLK